MTYDPADFRPAWCSIAAGCLIWLALLAGIAIMDPVAGPVLTDQAATSPRLADRAPGRATGGETMQLVLCTVAGRSS